MRAVATLKDIKIGTEGVGKVSGHHRVRVTRESREGEVVSVLFHETKSPSFAALKYDEGAPPLVSCEWITLPWTQRMVIICFKHEFNLSAAE